MARRDEKKKQRRQKRLEKRAQHQRPASGPDKLHAAVRDLDRLLSVPMPGSFPGGCDPSLDRPDMIKFELATLTTEEEPGKSKVSRMEDAAKRGLLAELPELADHWIMEEFLWHGAPGDTWHPVTVFLTREGERFPPAAAEQLRLWKMAELGLYEVGEVRDDTITFQAWDPVQQTHAGRPRRAISLNIGGVNAYQKATGAVTLTYLSPWSPANDLYCAMGYARTVPKRDAGALLPYLGLRHPAVVCRPLPWELNRAAAEDYLRKWQRREWHAWLGERLQFPFWALVGTPPNGEPALRQVTQLIPSTPLQAQQFGIYLLVPNGEESLATGCTMVGPIDVTSQNALVLAEYRAYRKRIGPPPATRSMPPFTQLR